MSIVNSPLDPFIALEPHQVAFQQATGATTIIIEGTADTATTFTTLSLFNDSTGEYINFLSTALANAGIGLRGTAFTNMFGSLNPVWTTTMKTGAAAADITSIRLWAGMCASNPVGLDAPGTIQLACFKYSTVTDTAFWRAVTCDGATTTTTVTTSAIAADTRYVFLIDWSNPARIDFWINDICVASHTTNLPAAATLLGWITEGSTVAASARNIRWRRTAFLRK